MKNQSDAKFHNSHLYGWLRRMLLSMAVAVSAIWFTSGYPYASEDADEITYYLYVYWEACSVLVPDFPKGEKLRERYYRFYESSEHMWPFSIHLVDNKVAKFFRILEDIENNPGEEDKIYEITESDGEIYLNGSLEYSDYLIKFVIVHCRANYIYNAGEK